MSGTKAMLAAGGAVSTAVLSAACCIGPLVLTFLGLGGVSLALALEPYRPWFLVGTALLLGTGFYLSYWRPHRECGEGEECVMPRVSRFGRVALWIAALVVVVAATFPNYSIYLF